MASASHFLAPALRPGNAARVRRARGASESVGKVAKQGSYRATNLPNDESDLLAQIHTAIQAALSDGKVLLEVEVPVTYFSGVVGVGCGDSIAISEYNANMTVLRKIVKLFEWLNQAPSVRVFFPDAAECSIALKGAGMNPVSGQCPGRHLPRLPWTGDYLLRDDFSQTTRKAWLGGSSGFSPERQTSNKPPTGDRLYVVGYPYDDSSEMEQVMELWNRHARPILVFNGNLDSIEALPWGKRRSSTSSCSSSRRFTYTFADGDRGWYRAYPGPWRVYRALPDGGMECVAEYDERPELRDVAMQFFSGGLVSSEVVVSAGDPEELSSDNTRYYELLGVVRDCDRKAINAAYREGLRRDTRTSAATPWIFTNSAKPSRC